MAGRPFEEPVSEKTELVDNPDNSVRPESWLLGSDDLRGVVSNQRQTLADLKAARERLGALNKATEQKYAAHSASFARATRIACDLQSDLTEIMRRISAVKEKLRSVQQGDENYERPQ